MYYWWGYEDIKQGPYYPFWEKDPSYIASDGQWEDSNDKVSIVSKISATSSAQANDTLEPILPAPQYKSPTTNFVDYVAFTKVSTYDTLF